MLSDLGVRHFVDAEQRCVALEHAIGEHNRWTAIGESSLQQARPASHPAAIEHENRVCSLHEVPHSSAGLEQAAMADADRSVGRELERDQVRGAARDFPGAG
jgi:hypothetical protein